MAKMLDWKFMAVLAIIAIVAVVYIMGQNNVAQTEVSTPVTDEGTVCQSDTSVTVTLSAVDKYTKGSANAEWFKYRQVGTSTWTSVISGGTFTATPYAEYEILAGNFTTGYGVHIPSYVAPCKTADTLEVETADKYTSGITGTFFNEAGTASTAQAMGPGDVKNVEFTITGTWKHDFGNAELGYNVISCKANSTEIDNVDIVGLRTTSEAGIVDSVISSTTGFDYYNWEFPVITSNNKLGPYTVTIDADDTINPVNDIVCTVYDSDYDIHATNGNVISGIQDEDKNNLGSDESSIAAVVTLDLS